MDENLQLYLRKPAINREKEVDLVRMIKFYPVSNYKE